MPSDEQKLSPRQIVERIRKVKFLLDIDSASDEFKEGALNLQTQLNNALQLLSNDLYSKKSHFVLELVQNADDNHYAPDTTPHLTLQVTPSRLVVVNNELGFAEANVNAICSVGDSSKSKEKEGYIGEKGIGFKSVFTVSDAPEIHSNGFHFKFDRTQEGNLLGYVVPHWCEAPPQAKPDCTTIILPAAKTYAFGTDTLVDLDARLLLFLNKLRQLTLVHKEQSIEYRREDKAGVSILSATSHSDKEASTTVEMHYVRSELTFKMDEKFADEKRPNIKQSSVVLAFPVDSKGAAKPEQESHVFAFLPIRPMGFRFSIQCDFILSSSREEILTDRPWNTLLRAGIVLAFSRSVERFKQSEPLALSYLKYIPEEGDIVEPFFRTTRKAILDCLSKDECLLSASGIWTRPSSLRIAEQIFRTLFPSETAGELFGFDYVDSRVQGGAPLLRSLGTKDAGIPEVLSIFSSHNEWLKQQPLEWRARFYAYLANNLNAFLSAGLLKCACLPISDGTYAIPAQSHVFFPLTKGKRYGFESEMDFIDNQLFEEAQKYSDHVPALFVAMKVSHAEPYERVMSHILPRHKGESWKKSDSKALLGHVRYIKDKLDDYLRISAAKGISESAALKLLREGLWIGTKEVIDGVWHFNRAEMLYLSKEYKPQFCVESMLEGALNIAQLVSPDYMASKPKDPESEEESWRQLLTKIGVRQAPAIEPEGFDWKCSRELQLLLDSSSSSVRRVTLECLSANWAVYSARTSYSLVIGRSTYSPRDTKFVQSLRKTLAPNKRKHPAPLSDSYYPTAELKSLLGESLPYVDATLSDAMLDACGVTRGFDAKALFKRLRQLKAEGGGTVKQIQGIYRALDERLWASDSTYIKQTFISEGLIQIKGVGSGWFTPGEVVWASNGTFLDSLYPPLPSSYRDFSRFFIDKLGVPRHLPIAKVVKALAHLDDIPDAESRKIEALHIYRRANAALAPKFGREVEIPEWIDTFQTDAVYINQRGDVVSNDGYLIANDGSEFAALFEDDEDLSFLAIPVSEVPRLSRLLDASGVARLSNSIQFEVRNVGAGDIDGDLTARIIRSTPYLARILYSRRPNEFEQAQSDGRLSRLRSMEVAKVEKVELVVSIGEYQRETTADMALSGNRILLRVEAKSAVDLLAAELSKHLAASTDLADTFARVLMENDASSIEDFLRVRNIGPLPADLLAALDSPAEPDEAEGATDSPSEAATVDAEENEDAPLEHGEISAEREVQPNTTTTEANGSRLGQPVPADTNSPGVVGSPQTIGPPSSPATNSGSRVRGALTNNVPESGKTGEHSTASTSQGESKSGQTNDSDHLPQAKKPFSDSNPISLGTSLATHSSNHAVRDGRRPKPGRQQPSRARTGRLLSYADGPIDPDKAIADEDPERVAARTATERAAVEYFAMTQASRWKSLKEMKPFNKGYDFSALAADNQEEFIEVKGQSGAWTEEGVALTPSELMTAQQKRSRYWLCVVEYAHDEKRRQLYLLRDPYGLTQQFRFDVGWKSAAENVSSVLMKPEPDMYIEMPGVGRGRILSVRNKGRFFNLHVILEDGRQVNRPFNPAKMTLSKEPTWQG